VSRSALWTLAAAGALVSLIVWWKQDRASACGSDFAAFYSAGRLAFTPDLYSPDAVHRLQRELLGCGEKFNWYIRLPYFAALMWPLARLPFETALWLWRVLSVAAIAGFILLWPGDQAIAAAACAWSLPLVTALAFGQDVPFLLLAIGVCAALFVRGHKFWSGAALALCAAKFHLFVLIPLWIVRRREWRFAAGGAIVGAGLLAASFIVGGWNWMAGYFAVATHPRSNPRPWDMFNLRGVVLEWPNAVVWEMAGAALVAVACWIAVRRASDLESLAIALTGGILAGHHSYLYDVALLIPACVTAIREGNRWIKLAALAVAAPVIFLLPAFPPLTSLGQLAVVLFFVALVSNRILSRRP
jgi:hypothetical protein